MKMKKRLELSAMTIFFAMLLGFAVMSIGTEQAFAMEGNGSEEYPYQISTYADLKEFAKIVNGTHESIEQNTAACAILTANISCDDELWVPIGNSSNKYTGTFEGNGKTITNLSDKGGRGAYSYQGLFGYIDSGGTVQNVGLEDAYIQGKRYVGGVAGSNEGTITNCYNTGDVSGSEIYVGGVAGFNFQGTITNCYNTGYVSGSDNSVGGVAGSNYVGTIENCYNTGAVTGKESVGGVAGNYTSTGSITGSITNCYNTGTVSGTGTRVGGVAGNSSNGSIINCYNIGTVSGTGTRVGGVAGYSFMGAIRNCYYDKEKCSLVNAIGNAADTDNVKGLKTAEMTGTDCTAYNDWENFSQNWYLTESYPLLGSFIFTAVWLDGDETTVLYSKEYLLGERPSTELTATKKAEAGNTYAFEKWDNGTLVDKTMTYRPVFVVTHEHKYGAWTKLNATQHQKVCEHDDTHVEKANHTWDAGKVTKKATEKATGIKTYTCTVCKATKTETIPKLKPTAPKTSGTPLAKATVKKNSLTIGWNKIQGAEGYDIFFALCNHGKKEIKCKKVKTIKAGKTFKWTKSGLKKGTAYKFYVRAYVTKNGKKTYVSKTPMFHAYTGNGTKNYTSAKSVTVNKTKLTLKQGKTFKIKAKVNKVNKKKKLMPKSHAPALRYMTSNKKIATVSSSGKITAKGKGTCVIYVYAHNGVSKSIKVTVP